MKRFEYKCHYPVFTGGFERQLVPFFRMEVLPGETINIDMFAKIKQATTNRPYLGMWKYRYAFFYVPHRQTWDGWVDYLLTQTGNPGVTISNGSARQFFDANGAFVNRMYRTAYVQIFNEYYRHPTEAEYAPTVGAEQTQFVARSGLLDYDWTNTEPPNSDVNYDVQSGSPDFVQINMNELRTELANAGRSRARSFSGDKYVDMLANYGVDASWMVADRPEVLHSGTWYQGAHDIDSTGTGTGLGERSTSEQTSVKVKVPNKKFAEHGYIWGLMYSDPHNFNDSKVRTFDSYRGPEEVFTPETANISWKETPTTVMSTASFGTLYQFPWQKYQQGEELVGPSIRGNSTENWALMHQVSAANDLLKATNENSIYYSPTTQAPPDDTTDGMNYCIRADVKVQRFNQVPPPGYSTQLS
ncbi:TPA_asm: major capsid protein [Microviridae sp.]|nr:TPA_asm: major capsid protein [Microviridae sp.]